jgi:hypothetical protein
VVICIRVLLQYHSEKSSFFLSDLLETDFLLHNLHCTSVYDMSVLIFFYSIQKIVGAHTHVCMCTDVYVHTYAIR